MTISITIPVNTSSKNGSCTSNSNNGNKSCDNGDNHSVSDSSNFHNSNILVIVRITIMYKK